MTRTAVHVCWRPITSLGALNELPTSLLIWRARDFTFHRRVRCVCSYTLTLCLRSALWTEPQYAKWTNWQRDYTYVKTTPRIHQPGCLSIPSGSDTPPVLCHHASLTKLCRSPSCDPQPLRYCVDQLEIKLSGGLERNNAVAMATSFTMKLFRHTTCPPDI